MQLITLDDDLRSDLAELVGVANRERAVALAVERFVERAKLEQGNLNVSDEALGQAYAEAAAEADFGWDDALLDPMSGPRHGTGRDNE